MDKKIPYKIYLEEKEMPSKWYNVRADMKTKPAPLLNPATLQPMTAKELGTVFCDELVRQELAQDRAYDGVLACGPKPMLRNVAKVAAEFGVPCQVSMEERMGCGVGACLVCATPMKDGTVKHVCKDGPVFDAEEVDWDA